PARWPDDAQRPLTARGAERTRLAARGLARVERSGTAILTSPYVRATETATILGEELGLEDTIETTELLAPSDAHRAMLHRLAAMEDSSRVFLVGHEPDLGKLAGFLLFGTTNTALPLRKAGACALSFEGTVRAGAAEL